MTDTVRACPECDAASLEERITKRPKYHCPECGAEFDEPVERVSRAGYANGPFGAKLLEMDADEVSRETAGLE